MDALEQIKQTFFQECEDLLSQLEAGLTAMQAGDRDPETINAIFRAVHSIKGGAGAFGMDDLVSYAHVFETTLDALRSGQLTPDDAMIAMFLRAGDLLSDHVAAARGGQGVEAARSAAILTELERIAAGEPAAAAGSETVSPAAIAPDEFGFVPRTIAFVAIPEPAAPLAGSGWTVRFAPHDSLYAKANDAIVLIRELGRLGPITATPDLTRLPGWDELQPERAYLSWTIGLQADVSEAAVREVFEFVDGDCDLDVSRTPGAIVSEPPVIHAPRPTAVVEAQPRQAAPAASPAGPPVSMLPEGQPASPPAGDAHKSQASATIRVDLDRIDRLINLVGELVINQAMLAQRAVESGFAGGSSVGAGLEELEELTREIQDSVMAIRAQPVKSVFQRMPRLVRETAAMTGKHVRLLTEGEGTEVDKTVIEQLADPITHMIRNAIDHGLEKPEKRVAAGKSEEGCVRLAALHRSGRIVIEVSDDGAGIDRARVRQIAEQKGLVAPDARLTDEELDNLIFLPGFSTAKEVSNVSGRGVGMDVVKRSIQALGGRISISSVPGKGSAFTMSLPLTLAVLDGMVVSVGDLTLIAPLTTVVESLRPKPDEVKMLGPTARVVAIRDAHVPLIDLGVVLGLRATPADPSEGVCILVENEVGARAALLVDGIQGQRQVVIKSLESNYQKIDLIAAATILGDGRVALILDVDAVIESSRGVLSRPAATPLKLAG